MHVHALVGMCMCAESQVVVSHVIWMLGTELESSAEAVHTLTAEPPLQILYKIITTIH